MCTKWHKGQETGDWAKDNITGTQLADELVNRTDFSDLPYALSNVVNQIVEEGKYNGIEVGFMYRIGQYIAVGKRASE